MEAIEGPQMVLCKDSQCDRSYIEKLSSRERRRLTCLPIFGPVDTLRQWPLGKRGDREKGCNHPAGTVDIKPMVAPAATEDIPQDILRQPFQQESDVGNGHSGFAAL